MKSFLDVQQFIGLQDAGDVLMDILTALRQKRFLAAVRHLDRCTALQKKENGVERWMGPIFGDSPQPQVL